MKLWTPPTPYIKQSALTAFKTFVEKKHTLEIKNYEDFWNWSIKNIEDFWQAIFEHFKIISGTPYHKVLTQPNPQDFIGSKWFEGATISYAEHIFRNYTDTHPAIIYKNENEPVREVSWRNLRQQTLAIRQFLISSGIKKGDTVAAVLNNSPETVAIFLAANSIGAIWSCCSPDFGSDSIFERFNQISPKILFADKSYQYNGKTYKKDDLINDLANRISSIDDVVVVGDLKWRALLALAHKNTELSFDRVAFDHPIWVLYSSGTTGKPKAITHSTGGNLLEHYKALMLHQNVQEGERFMWYSTTGWMMWNYAIASLLTGATLCIYDGALSYPDMDTAWQFAKNTLVDHFGGGAAFYIACEKQNLDLPPLPLKTLGSTGSPLPPETFEWLQNKFKNVQIISLSGGTDVCSAFLSGCPWLPVYSGEIQCRTLGSDISALNDEGKEVINELGELVINQPMPSMPVYFWNDKENQKYRESYFEKYPGKWYHGDWIKITPNQGVVIFGRSDATLNRGGVRIGTAEIYNVVQEIPEIADSLVVTVDYADGQSEMVLFVKMNSDFTPDLKKEVANRLREKYSPRHVPDRIEEVPDIPYTLSGKKLELPVKRLLMGQSLEKAVSLDAVKNPEAFNFWLRK